ncbi:Endo-1,4-beta-xylanase, GH35 family [Gracilibacillus ureilyticus]|uniref:Beta-xylanase n=1 Tax=Gracilibacillus ureilyticus TaxID=531814 RepID=A0A1H9MNW8_9BACI|nr:Endo-1,4-beta-xylanase, GH35 family [Gracilibacillus ureilyticus]
MYRNSRKLISVLLIIMLVFPAGWITTSAETATVDEETRPTAAEFNPITFEDQTTGGFEGRSGTETLTVTDEANHTDGGAYALKVEDRAENWHGPTLNVASFIEKGQEYNISAWVKLISPESSQLQLSTQVGNGDNASYNNLQEKTVSTSDGWVQLEGTYRYSSLGDEFLTIYVESANNSTASFYIDDITFEPTDSGAVEIEKDLTPIKEIYQDDFLIGNAVSDSEFEGNRLELLKMHHNLITAENAMKPAYAYNEQGEFDFTAEDSLVQKAKDEGLLIHGHVLVWHQQSREALHTDENGNPLSREQALENLRNHVKTTVEHFGDSVISWDVVNEAMNDNPPNPSDWKASLRQSGWLEAIGPDYLEQAYRAAKEVIDENGWDIQLYYNDYNDDNQNKAEAIYQMVKEINENYAAENDGELLIDGIGMQAHYNLNTNPENVRRSMEKFISLGVEVGVTELDVTAGSDNELTEQQAQAQAYLYAQLFSLYKEHAEHISRVTFWGLNDSTSWRAAQSPLLFDEDLQAKPAYYAIMDPEKFIAEYEPVEKEEANQGNASHGTPVIDGQIDEVWDNAAELPVNRYQMAWQGASGVAKALWDEENLYVLVQVSDDTLDKSSANSWEQDSVEVFVDENNGKTAYYEEDDGQYRVNFDNETSFNPESIAENFESATKVSDGGYTVEVKIPFRTITPENNAKIGFDVQINDGKDGARQSIATWNDLTGAGFQDTSVFGELTLVGSNEEEQPEKPTPGKPNKPGKPDKPGKTKKVVIANPPINDNKVLIDDEIIEKVQENGVLEINISRYKQALEIVLTNDQIIHLKEQNATITIKQKNANASFPASVLSDDEEEVAITFDQIDEWEQAWSKALDLLFNKK